MAVWCRWNERVLKGNALNRPTRRCGVEAPIFILLKVSLALAIKNVDIVYSAAPPISTLKMVANERKVPFYFVFCIALKTEARENGIADLD